MYLLPFMVIRGVKRTAVADVCFFVCRYSVFVRSRASVPVILSSRFW